MVPPFHRYYWGAPTSCRPSSRRSGFPRSAVPRCAACSLSPACGATPVSPGISRQSPEPSPRGDDRTSQVPGEPVAGLPCSTIPPGRPPLAMARRPVLPAWNDGPSAPERDPFEIQLHGPLARCLRFTVRVTPTPRKTRCRPAGYALVGRDFHPLDSILKFQGDIDFLLPPEPVLAWRTSNRSLARFPIDEVADGIRR